LTSPGRTVKVIEVTTRGSTERVGSVETDAELVARLVQGDDRALAEVYRRHAPQVLAVANAVLRNQAAAEDVGHDVFVRLSRQPLSFDGGRGPLGTYLVVVAHGLALDRLRFEQAWSAPSAGDEAVTLSTPAEVWAAVSALPVQEAEALRLAYFGGATSREVARILEVAEETVASRIRSGLRRLRAAFIDQGIVHAT
jgi:RNA polymerase sigma-70 factor (ECF subfamily)